MELSARVVLVFCQEVFYTKQLYRYLFALPEKFRIGNYEGNVQIKLL